MQYNEDHLFAGLSISHYISILFVSWYKKCCTRSSKSTSDFVFSQSSIHRKNLTSTWTSSLYTNSRNSPKTAKLCPAKPGSPTSYRAPAVPSEPPNPPPYLNPLFHPLTLHHKPPPLQSHNQPSPQHPASTSTSANSFPPLRYGQTSHPPLPRPLTPGSGSAISATISID